MYFKKLQNKNVISLVDTRGIENSWSEIISNDRAAHIENIEGKAKFGYLVYMTDGKDLTIRADTIGTILKGTKIVYVPENVNFTVLMCMELMDIINDLFANHRSALRFNTLQVITTDPAAVSIFETMLYAFGKDKCRYINLVVLDPLNGVVMEHKRTVTSYKDGADNVELVSVDTIRDTAPSENPAPEDHEPDTTSGEDDKKSE